MNIIVAEREEFRNVMQNVNLVKIRIGCGNAWEVAPLLYTDENSIDVLLQPKDSTLQVGEDVVLKFQHLGYEYLVSGNVTGINQDRFSTVTVKYALIQKYHNMRRHMRYDTNLSVVISTGTGACGGSTVKNISRGGAMIISGADISAGTSVELSITFDSGNAFTSIAKVIRKSVCDNGLFGYGVEFTDISPECSRTINREISKYEMEYLKSLDIFREFKKGKSIFFDTRIAILCFDNNDNYSIKEALVKLGAENFEAYHNFRMYAGFFEEEQPKLVIIDAHCFSPDIMETVNFFRSVHPDIPILLVLPVEASKSGETDKLEGLAGEDILYKPLIYNEFEQAIVKYL